MRGNTSLAPSRGSWRDLAPYILRHWRLLAVIALLTVAGSSGAALQPWPLKIMVDHALAPEGTGPALRFLDNLSPRETIAAAVMASLVVFAFTQAVSFGLSWVWTVVGQRMMRDLALDVFARLQRLSVIFHSRNRIGDSLTRLTGDTWCVYTLTGALFSPLTQAATLAAVGAVAWALQPGLALLAFSTAPMLALASVFFGERLKRRAHLGRRTESRLTSFVHQTLSSIPLVQAFSAEERNSRHFRSLASDAVLISQRSELVGGAYWLASGAISAAGGAVVLYAGSRQVLAGHLSVGSLLVFLAYLRTMQLAVEALIRAYATFKPVEASIERVMEILAAHDEDVIDIPGARRLEHTDSAWLRIEDVTFGYERGRPVLHGVSLEAQPGSMTALVGVTGSGKSTLVSLVPRFFDPWEGRIVLNGSDIRELEIASLRARIAMVLQEPFLFSSSVVENIGYGRPGASFREIEAAAEAANADAFIRRLPQGYNTVLGEEGCTLSAGERQRISIARALLKNAPILILDEPTSALDAHAEASLQEALGRLIEGRTTIVIAHRLSTIAAAAQVVVLAAGRIVESGAPADLLASDGVYQRLHALQFADEVRA